MMAVTGGARDGSGGRTPPSRGAMGGGRKRKNGGGGGSASAGTPSRGGKGGRCGCTSPSVTTNLLLQINIPALQRRTTSHYFGTHVRLGRSNRHWRARRHWRGRRLLHMSTSAGLSGLPGKSGVSGTTSDAPEEATQRPPFLALRGPSHSHPGALLHRRRRITLWQTTSPATSGPFPWGGGMVGRGPRGSIGTIGSSGSGSSGSGSSGRRSFGGRSFGGRSFGGSSFGGSSFGGRSAGMNGPQYTQGNFHHQGQPPGQ